MNAYPYTSGHLMVAPLRHEGTLSGLSTDEANALMAMTQDATVAVDGAFQPDGANVGVNIGRAGGAGIPGHVHVHVVPAMERRHQLHDHASPTRGCSRSRCG